jgi:probable HAF family extracellular repeat protein
VNQAKSERRFVLHAPRVVIRLELAMAFASSALLGCHEAPTAPIAQRVESGSRPATTITVGSFTLTTLPMTDGYFSAAAGVNAAGDIVGITTDSIGVQIPTLWPADGSAPLDLGSVDGDYIGPSADAINTAGDIVGMADNGIGQGPTLWPAGGGAPRNLGSLPGTLSLVHGMNDAGDVVGESSLADGTAARATVWPLSGPPRELPSLGQQSAAFAINSAGTIVGWSYFSGGATKATIWPAGGGPPVDLGSPPGATWCDAQGINDAGDVVGSCQGGAGVPAGAILWPADGSPPRYLETSGGYATAINNAGDVVGSIRVGTGDHAALWPGDGSGMLDLGALPLFERTVVTGINSSRRIVGYTESLRLRLTRAVVWEPLVQQPQSITFTSSPPNSALVDGKYAVSATGGGSGNAVTFTSLTATVCSVAGNAVSLNAGGTCTVAADQAASAGYLAAPEVTQSFVVNTRPVANAGAAQTGDEGSTITFNAGTSSDADGDALVAYAWDFGDGTVQSVSSPTVAHSYSDNKAGGGAYVVTLQVTDARGATSTVVNTSALIGNIDPVATFDPASPVGEGIMGLSLAGAQDAPGDISTLQYAFDCGSGTGYGAFSASPSTACVVPDDGVRTVRAKIKDKDDAEAEYTKSVTVVNVTPTIAITSAPSGKTGVDYTLAFRFTDPGTADAPWLYQILWGDGKRDAAPKSTRVQGATITDSYRYNKPGTYSIMVRVTDKDGAVATSNVQVTILK